ncbi:hypothetical protein H2200_008649 [Cladophialophora chaetospira]|uniref:Asl1-like glycosyl hydrolase catalytic domain-containing protein n=1 Tax=Cladophialophora chaetospira TaxID=386627 RepID=A0AA39CFR0_9EURO|nr:hypothetical protein H2200_008649 [Cladophialophora chaetospira]
MNEKVVSIAHPEKRGLSWPWDNTAPEFALYQSFISSNKITWLYNWEMWQSPGLPHGLEYVPQVRLGSQAAQIDQFLSQIHAKHFIGFNEPEMVSESNMPVGTAIALWKQYVEPAKGKFHFHLGSPAMTSSPQGKAWLQSFWRECGSSIDFVVVHWYGTDANQLETFLKDMYATFKKPLWLTEFAYSFQRTTPPVPTTAEVEDFLKKALPMLDSLECVERYAFSGSKTDVGAWVGEANNMSNGGHTLTGVGKLYGEL